MTHAFVAAMLVWTGAAPEDLGPGGAKPFAGTVTPAAVKPGPYPDQLPRKPGGAEPEPGALTVGDVIAALQLDESTFRFIDEPPGKLREIQTTATLGDTKVKVTVSIQIRYTPELMSVTGKWTKEKVRAARVVKVTINNNESSSLKESVKPDPFVPRFSVPLKDPQKVYGASWLSIRANRLGIRYHTGLTKDRIVIYALSARGADEIATWSVDCDELIRQSVSESCAFSDCGRCVFYITETEVRARLLGTAPIDICLCRLKLKGAYWEQVSLVRGELFCVSRVRNTKQLQVTTVQLAGADAGRVDTRELKSDVLDKIDRLHILAAAPEWLYLMSGDGPVSAARVEALDLRKDRAHAVATIGARLSAGATSSSGLLAIGTFSGCVHLADLKTQQQVCELVLAESKRIAAVSWSRDGNYLAAGVLGKVDGAQLFVCRAPFREKLFSVRVTEFGCERVALADNGEWVAGFGFDRTIRVWKVPTEW
jgi:hypothetical protein